MTTGLFSAGFPDGRSARNADGSERLGRISCETPFEFFMSGWKFNLFYSRAARWFGAGEKDPTSAAVIGESNSSAKGTMGPVPALSAVIPLWGACTDRAALIVADDGALWGSGGKFGTQWHKISNVRKKCRFVAAGTDDVCIIPEGKGIFFSWDNLGEEGIRYACPEIEFVDCAVGSRQYLAIAKGGKLYTWGHGGACGQGPKFSAEEPTKVDIEDVVFVRCFAYSSCSWLVDQEDGVWSCGVNSHGQIGQGEAIKKIKVFTKVPGFSPGRIAHICCGDSMSYVLTELGDLYACGEGENYKLMMGDKDAKYVPTLCTDCEKMKVNFVSCGCSHAILQAGTGKILPHPIVGVEKDKNEKQFWVTVPARGISPEMNVDIGCLSSGMFGIGYGERVKYRGQEYTFLGTNSDLDIVLIDDKGECLFLCGTPMDFNLLTETNHETRRIRARSGAEYLVNIEANLLRPFGFRVDEKVSCEYFGNGRIAGVFAGKLFIEWEHDGWLASTGGDCSIEKVHPIIKITEAVGRSVERMKVGEIEANVETTPCELLEKYGLKVNDLVCAGDVYGFIVGELGMSAVVKDLSTHDNILLMPTEMKLLRRECEEPVYVKEISFSEEFVDVDVSFKASDRIIPGDRVLMNKQEFATVLGRSKDKFWVKTDTAYRLHLGAVEISEPKDLQLVRRLDLSLRSTCGFMNGDIVQYQNKKYFIVETGPKLVLQRMTMYRRETVTVDDNSLVELVFRMGLCGVRYYPVRRALKKVFEVGSHCFHGMRVFPGDLVSVQSHQMTVIGLSSHMVWLNPVTSGESILIQQQALYDPNILKIIRRVDQFDSE